MPFGSISKCNQESWVLARTSQFLNKNARKKKKYILSDDRYVTFFGNIWNLFALKLVKDQFVWVFILIHGCPDLIHEVQRQMIRKLIRNADLLQKYNAELIHFQEGFSADVTVEPDLLRFMRYNDMWKSLQRNKLSKRHEKTYFWTDSIKRFVFFRKLNQKGFKIWNKSFLM